MAKPAQPAVVRSECRTRRAVIQSKLSKSETTGEQPTEAEQELSVMKLTVKMNFVPRIGQDVAGMPDI